MNNRDTFIKLSQSYYEQQLSNIKETIKEYLSNCGGKVNINSYANWYIESLKLEKNAEYVPSFASVTDDGLNVLRLDDELVDFIVSNIPSNVRELVFPLELVKNHLDVFRKIPNLETIGISGVGSITLEELKYLSANTKIKDIEMPLVEISDINQSSVGSYYCDDTTHIQYNNVNIKAKAPKMNSIILNDINDVDIIDQLPEGFINDSYSIIYKENEIARMNSSEIQVLLQDNIRGIIDIVNKIIDKLETKPKKVIIITENKTIDNIEQIDKLNEIVPVSIDYGEPDLASLDDFKSMRGTLDYFKGLVLQNDLSPAERVCYAYDLIKSHIYRENEEKLSQSRYIHSIVSTGNIVCVGYAKFFAQLLKECGITAHSISTKVPLIDDSLAGHQRNIVEIDDDKYNIHGVFAFDPTWDSNYEYTVVNRNGEIRPTSKIRESDEIIGETDPMSSYIYFFIPASQYGFYFPEEKQHERVSDWEGETFDPNTEGSSSISRANHDADSNSTLYNSAEAIDDNVILELIYHTRSMEGYSEEYNKRLIEEVKLLRDTRRPKELRAEEGMVL